MPPLKTMLRECAPRRAPRYAGYGGAAAPSRVRACARGAAATPRANRDEYAPATGDGVAVGERINEMAPGAAANAKRRKRSAPMRGNGTQRAMLGRPAQSSADRGARAESASTSAQRVLSRQRARDARRQRRGATLMKPMNTTNDER